MTMSIMLMLMAYDCRVRNMSCFRAKPASADSVALLAIVLPDHDDGDLIMENNGTVDAVFFSQEIAAIF